LGEGCGIHNNELCSGALKYATFLLIKKQRLAQIFHHPQQFGGRTAAQESGFLPLRRGDLDLQGFKSVFFPGNWRRTAL